MEETLYNPKGQPIAYIEMQSSVTYLWNGKPVAYLADEHIYGFNGKHLGWFIKGVIWDETGRRVGFTKATLPVYASYEPYKSYKQYVPYKSYKSYPPYKPYFSNSISSHSLDSFLMQGV
ncbi:hypothetical protein GCM10022408_32520 [Hymenobacter fastidiosus]|uniref:4-fold beta flower domain-containing protein n=1 Tax=Hymenobacter fastidiosus TaxID=486264 RepID=A0ABP7SV87_9BACT